MSDDTRPMGYLVPRWRSGSALKASRSDRRGKYSSKLAVHGRLWILLLVTALLVGLAGCSNSPAATNSNTNGPGTTALPPNITSLSQTSGTVGTSITITGTNFGSTQGSSTVTFNGMSAGAASAWSATSITVTVPTGATTGNVVVTVLGAASNGVAFTVPPTITSLSQTSGAVGVSITITGTNFGATQGSSTVTFNGTSAGNASAWSATSITVTVPTGATTGDVVVTVGGLASNGSPFTVVPPPSTTCLIPASGAEGTSIT